MTKKSLVKNMLTDESLSYDIIALKAATTVSYVIRIKKQIEKSKSVLRNNK
ncbi:MAG: hypothetical protein V4547_18235 [Bacteroidota bacterium]